MLYQANTNTVSYVYWGSTDGYTTSSRSELPTIGTLDSTVADFNNDGYLDILFSSYHGGDSRLNPACLYWNGPDGFDPKRRTLIPAASSCGLFSADLDFNGYRDLIIANHLIRSGEHRTTYVSIYWGDTKGYSTERMTKLPATGPHFLSYVDVGNIYDRSNSYDYISVPFDADSQVKFKSISWQGQTPFRTRIEFQVRAAESIELLKSTPWHGPNGPGSFYRKKSSLKSLASNYRWIQYKATLISPNSSNTPVLRSVSIGYD